MSNNIKQAKSLMDASMNALALELPEQVWKHDNRIWQEYKEADSQFVEQAEGWREVVDWVKKFQAFAEIKSKWGNNKIRPEKVVYEIIQWIKTHKNDICDDNKHKRPIPLTPEILEKCGFEKIDDKVFQKPETRYELNEFTFITCLMWRAHPMEHIKNLHQLQNLYSALTGTELNYQP